MFLSTMQCEASTLPIQIFLKEAMIMKRFMTISLVVLITISFAAGCVTTPLTKSSSSRSSSSAKKAEKGTYSQVPASMRADVKEAQFDVKLARNKQKVADEKVKLADLKKERAILGSKYAQHDKKLADILVQKTEMIVEVKKAEAIDNAGLGDKEDNIKQIANLKTKELDITTDEIKIKADIDTTKVKLKKLDKQIRKQEKKVAKASGGTKKSKSGKKRKKVSKKK